MNSHCAAVYSKFTQLACIHSRELQPIAHIAYALLRLSAHRAEVFQMIRKLPWKNDDDLLVSCQYCMKLTRWGNSPAATDCTSVCSAVQCRHVSQSNQRKHTAWVSEYLSDTSMFGICKCFLRCLLDMVRSGPTCSCRSQQFYGFVCRVRVPRGSTPPGGDAHDGSVLHDVDGCTQPVPRRGTGRACGNGQNGNHQGPGQGSGSAMRGVQLRGQPGLQVHGEGEICQYGRPQMRLIQMSATCHTVLPGLTHQHPEGRDPVGLLHMLLACGVSRWACL